MMTENGGHFDAVESAKKVEAKHLERRSAVS